MELRDFVVTPFIILILYGAAYLIRPKVTDAINRRYFISALTVRIIGALALGFVYQFYYGGGDTFNYHTSGSRVVWEAVLNDPYAGVRLIFGSFDNELGVYEYSSRIAFFGDPSTYFIVRIAALFDLLTFSTYSATAVLFSVISFIGTWMLFLTFYKQYPESHRGIALATLFIPSVFFWGSGLLKDTVILGCLGIVTYQCHRIFFERRLSIGSVSTLLFSLYIIFSIRVFILQAYVPALIVWIVAQNIKSIRSLLLRIMIVPFIISLLIFSSYFTVDRLGRNDVKYSLENLTKTAQSTAYDIGFYTGRNAGSGYALSISDWTPEGMLLAAPAAINVTFFRPYLWEVRNVLMLVSAIESLLLLIFTVYVLFRSFRYLLSPLGNANMLFCLSFSLTYAYAVGISTYNFGTLTRYKIPAMPFFLLALIILLDYSNKARKLARLDLTE